MIARKSALIIAMQIMNGILAYIGLKFIALYMEPWEYGVIGFAFGFVSLFVIFGRMGFNEAHVKRISEGKDFKTCVGTYMVTKTFLSGLLAIMVIGSIAIWKYGLGRGFESPVNESAVYIMLTYFVLFILTQSITSTFVAKKEIAKSELPLFCYNFVRVVATILVAYFGFGVLALAYTYVLGEIFHFIFAIYLFRGYHVGKPSLECFKDYSKFAIPMAIASASYLIMTNIDKVFIQLFWGATQVGEYFAVFNLSRFMILFVAAVGILLLPTISEHHVKNNFRKIREIVMESERYLSMLVFPIVFIMIVLAEPIIGIMLSNKYLPAIGVLQILPLFVLLDTLSRPYSAQLSGMDRPDFSRNRLIIMVIFNVLLNLILIPRDIRSLGINLFGMGAQGAAIATVISYMIGLVYVRVTVWKMTKMRGNPKIFLHLLAASIMAGILYWLNTIFNIIRWYDLLSFCFLGLGIYLFILYLLREFAREDFDFFVDVLNIRKMIKYIKEEIKN